MKVALIVPQNKFKNINSSKDGFFDYQEIIARERIWSCPDLSLLTIAGMMPDYFEIEYIDLNHTGLPSKQFDIVFFSPTTAQAPAVYKLAEEFKNKGTLVVMGGIHVTYMEQEASKFADVLFMGECEDTFPKFVSDLKNNNISKIYRSTVFPDLKNSSIPRYDLVKGYPYRSIAVQTSRGCPHQCSFCISSNLYGISFRHKSLETVIEEINTIKDNIDYPYIFFSDDNIFLKRKFAEGLLSYLKNERFNWSAFSDLKIAEDTEFLKDLSLSGCNRLIIGFESLSKDNLLTLNENKWKRNRRDQYKDVIQKVQSHGIGVVGSFVLGFDQDNELVFDELYDFIIDTKLFATNITILTPFPGSQLYSDFCKEKRIYSFDWSRYNGFELTFKTQGISKDKFMKCFNDLNRKLNSGSRIQAILKNFKQIYNQDAKSVFKTEVN